MLWEMIPDYTEYDLFDGAIVSADTKEEAEKIANVELKGDEYAWEGGKPQKWRAIPFEYESNSVVFSSFRAG